MSYNVAEKINLAEEEEKILKLWKDIDAFDNLDIKLQWTV